MKRTPFTTADGSTTLAVEGWNEHYHSTHGALQESQYVYIKNGLELFKNRPISILEIGFGTGLNALLTYLAHDLLQLSVTYYTIEGFPISLEEAKLMNYTDLLQVPHLQSTFEHLHSLPAGEIHTLSENFLFRKEIQLFETISFVDSFDLIYFDAFGARVQPELWTENIFFRMFRALKKNGKLVTYASNGNARRAMLQVGFLVEKLQGPKGKREMIRATKV